MRYHNIFFAILKLYFWSIQMANTFILAIFSGFKLNSNLKPGKNIPAKLSVILIPTRGFFHSHGSSPRTSLLRTQWLAISFAKTANIVQMKQKQKNANVTGPSGSVP